MSEDLYLAGMAKRTHEGYLRAVRTLADFCRRTPDQISEDQLRKYFLHLKNDRQFASGSLRVAFSGIKFFYTRICRRQWETLTHMKVPNAKTLPEVITTDQVHQIIDSCTTQRMAVYFWTVYSLGLRMQEALHLEVGDIDAERGMVHVHRGKGAKDRYVPLPLSTLALLRQFWKQPLPPTAEGGSRGAGGSAAEHPRFLFPADGRNHRSVSCPRGPSPATTPMSPTPVQGVHCVSAQRAIRSNSLAQRARSTGPTQAPKAQRAGNSIRRLDNAGRIVGPLGRWFGVVLTDLARRSALSQAI